MDQSPSKSRLAGTVHTYVFYDPLRHWVKIGRSVDPGKRLRSLRAASGADLVFMGAVPHDCEGSLHAALRAARLKGEWFLITDGVRAAVGETFGCDLPAQSMADAEVSTERTVRALEKAWNIPLAEPSPEWFVTLALVLEETHGVDEDDTVAGLELLNGWPEWILAVGGDATHGQRLGVVLADRPRPPEMHQLLRSWWWMVDSYIAVDVAVASDPPASLAEIFIESPTPSHYRGDRA